MSSIFTSSNGARNSAYQGLNERIAQVASTRNFNEQVCQKAAKACKNMNDRQLVRFVRNAGLTQAQCDRIYVINNWR